MNRHQMDWINQTNRMLREAVAADAWWEEARALQQAMGKRIDERCPGC